MPPTHICTTPNTCTDIILISVTQRNQLNEDTCPWSHHLAGTEPERVYAGSELWVPLWGGRGSHAPKHGCPSSKVLPAPPQGVPYFPVTVPNIHMYMLARATHTHTHTSAPHKLLCCGPFCPGLWLCSFSPSISIKTYLSRVPYFRTLLALAN